MRPAESFVEQPIRSLQTMLRVLAEDDRHLPTVVPDGIYGPTTMQVISAFQRRSGLPANGITDQQTWDAVVSAYEDALVRVDKAEPIEIILDAGQVLRLGDQNPYVYLLQSILIQLSTEHPSVSPLSHTGTFDIETENALIAFQKLSDLPATGELDKITWKHLSRQFTLYAQHVTNRRKTIVGDLLNA
jgi:peptidoglycan hydrolase-like protein with peptidoglycan-binding domain